MEALLIGGIVGFIILVSLLIHLIRRANTKAIAGKTKVTIAPRMYSAFTIHRISSSYGLNRDQTKLLEFVFRNDSVTDPLKAIKDPNLLDKHFRRAFKSIQRNSISGDDAQERLIKLFSLRNVLESADTGESSSTAHIAENTPAILVSGRENYPVKVYASEDKNIVTDLPRNALGTPIRFSRGAKASLSFFANSNNGFYLECQISGTPKTSRGQGLQLTHNGKKKPLVKRRFRRKQTDCACEFFFVNIVETGKGRKKTSKLVLDNRRFVGTVQDISAGGCAIKTTVGVQAGSRLKIVIQHNDAYVITVLGQVIRSNRSSLGIINHIKFLKIPKKAFISISTWVFGYNDD